MFVFKYFPKVVDFFKYFFKYIVLSEPEDGLAPDSDHRSMSPLFFIQAPSWYQTILDSWLTLKLSCHISSQHPTSY